MTCPNCGVDLLVQESTSGLCPLCGAVLSSAPQGQKVLPTQKTGKRSFSGPLLTGNPIIDKTFGFLGEITAYALLIYALIILLQGTAPVYTFLGYIVTAAFLWWHSRKMNERFPVYSEGWQASRTMQGRIWNILVTCIFGIATMIIIFPIGIGACTIGMQYGPIGWGIVLLLAYLIGFIMRRITGNKANNKTP